jgi:hypothetical protein
MLFLIGLLAAYAGQSGDVTLTPQAEKLVEETTSCIDEALKTQLEKHLLDSKPDAIVDGALEDCKRLKAAYPDPELADRYFASLRKLYLDQLQATFAKPAFAEKRAAYLLAQWRQCVTDKATDWSRLKDEANTVAKAAVTSCAQPQSNALTAIGYELRSKGLKSEVPTDMADKLVTTMTNVAVETVISERAKRLPAR